MFDLIKNMFHKNKEVVFDENSCHQSNWDEYRNRLHKKGYSDDEIETQCAKVDEKAQERRKRYKNALTQVDFYNFSVDDVKNYVAKGANVFAINDKCENLIFNAVRAGNAGVVKYLIEQGVAPDVENGKQERPMNIAAKKGHIVILGELIKLGIDVNKPRQGGITPLMDAVLHGYTDSTRYLIKKDADLERKNDEGDTALMLAFENGRKPCIKALINAGACVNIADKNGKTPEEYAKDLGDSEISELVQLGKDPAILKAKQAERERIRREKIENGPSAIKDPILKAQLLGKTLN